MFTFFKKKVSITEFPAEPCRWCQKRIGADSIGHYPIPVCRSCFLRAFEHGSPVFCCVHGGEVLLDSHCEHRPVYQWPGNIWEKLMTEFRPQAILWVKRIGRSTTVTDMATSAIEAQGDLANLQKERIDLVQGGRPSSEIRAVDERIALLKQGLTSIRSGLADATAAAEKERKDEGLDEV